MYNNVSAIYIAKVFLLFSILYYGLSFATLKALEKAKRLKESGKEEEYKRYMKKCILIKFAYLTKKIRDFFVKSFSS